MEAAEDAAVGSSLALPLRFLGGCGGGSSGGCGSSRPIINYVNGPVGGGSSGGSSYGGSSYGGSGFGGSGGGGSYGYGK